MMIAIRIGGLVGVREKQERTMETLMLRRKYNCIILPKEEIYKLNTVREMLSFGEVSDETLKQILIARAVKANKPISNADEVIKGLNSGKSLKEMGLRPYLKLHPPRGGFKKSTKLPYPQGILGNNNEIEKLVKKML